MSDLPQGWEESSLGIVAVLNMGQSPKGSATNVSGDGLPLIGGASDYDNGKLAAVRFTSKPTKVCAQGDLVLCIRATIGKVAKADKRYCLGRGVAGLTSMINREYLKYFLSSQSEALDQAGTGTTFRQIDKKTLASWSVPVPPLPEQRRIVAKLDSLFARTRQAREELARIPTLIEHYKQAILAAAFRGDLTAEWRDRQQISSKNCIWEQLPKELDNKSLPCSWMVLSIDDLMENHDRNRVPIKASDRALRRGNYPYYGASGKIDTIDDYLFDGDFLLISEDGANLVARSTPIAYEVSGRFWVNNHAHVLRASSMTTNSWVCHFINWINLEPYVTGSAQPKLSQKNLNRIHIPIPSLPEQQQILQQLDQAFYWLNNISEQLSLVNQLLPRLNEELLAKAFQGELVPQNPDDEPASVLLERIRTERSNQPKPTKKHKKSRNTAKENA